MRLFSCGMAQSAAALGSWIARQGGSYLRISIGPAGRLLALVPACLVLSVLCLAPLPSLAQSALYAVDGAHGNPSPSLYRLDPSDGSVIQEIGPIHFKNVAAIAFDPITGVLYGSTSTRNGGTGEIITIDLETGAGTAVGSHGVNGTPDLAFSPAGIFYGWSETSDDLVSIDISTGVATVVGNCGPGTSRTGLEVDMAGNAYMKSTSTVYSVDRNTGACTLLVNLGQSLRSSFTFDQRGTLYSHEFSGGGSDIYSVDLETGTTTLVGSNGLADLSSLAFQPPPNAPLYAVDGAGNNPAAATLYRLDPRDGSLLQTIGSTGFDDLGGISFHPVTGVLYGTQSASKGAAGQLITIDLQSGAGAAVGAAHGDDTPDLAFAPSGNLYAWTEALSADDMVQLDLTTGATAVVGNCGSGTAGTGLAVDYSGDAYVKARGTVFSVDRITGACTSVQVFSILFENVLEFSPRGTPYTLERLGSGLGADLYTLDFETGLSRFVGNVPLEHVSGLAFQPPPLPPLYATDGGSGSASTLYRLDPRDGSVLETIGAIGFSHVTSLAFHPVTGVLYGQSGSNGGTQQLITIDVGTGAGTAVGGTGLAKGTPDLDFAPSGLLYGWDEGSNDDLAIFDLTTGAATTLGNCGFASASTGVGVDKFGTAWMNSGYGALYTVDRVTGACTLAATQPTTLNNSLTFSPQGTAYAIERISPNASLFALDTETGDRNLIGTNGITNLSAVAFKPVRHSNLYAVDGANSAAASLYLIDPDDGSLVWNLGPTGFDHVTGIAFNPLTNELYGGTGVNGSQELIRIDPETGAGTAVGSHLLTRGPADLAFAPSGILYGWDEALGADDLARFDLATGNATVVGECGTSTSRTGLAIDRVGTAYMKTSSNIYTVDRVTGACSVLVGMTGSTRSSLTFDGRIDRLYTHDLVGLGADILSVDLTTGNTTRVGSNSLANLSSLAFRLPPLPPLYATDGAGGNAASLYRLDPRDGSVIQTIGPIGFDNVTGLAFSPSLGTPGTLYGTTASNAGTQELITVDRDTGTGVAVGPHGITSGSPDLTFSGSVLYGWDEPTNDDLVSFNLVTGQASAPIGDCGVFTSGTGLATDPLGNAFMKNGVSSLYSVDLGTGACTLAVTLGPSGGLQSMLEVSDRGTFYSGNNSGALSTIDPQTGDVIPLGASGITDLSAVAMPLPEPSALLGLGAGIVALAAMVRLRRR
jgi:hypothetical protein